MEVMMNRKFAGLLFFFSILVGLPLCAGKKSIKQFYAEVQEIAQRCVQLSGNDYLERASKHMSELHRSLLEQNTESLDDQVTAAFLEDFIPTLQEFIKLQLELSSCGELDILVRHVTDFGQAQKKFVGFNNYFSKDQELLLQGVQALLKKIYTTQLFVAIDHFDLDAVKKFLELGADVNGADVQRRGLYEVASLLDAQEDEDKIEKKLAIQSILADYGAKIDVDKICPQLEQRGREQAAAQALKEKVIVEPKNVAVAAEEIFDISEEDTDEEVADAAGASVVRQQSKYHNQGGGGGGAKARRKHKKAYRGKGKSLLNVEEKSDEKKKALVLEQQLEEATERLTEAVKEFGKQQKRKENIMGKLIDCVKSGNLPGLKRIIKILKEEADLVDVNDIEAVGTKRTGLLVCLAATMAKNGSLLTLLRYKEMLKLNLEVKDSEGCRPLELAIGAGDLLTVRALVHAGACVNAPEGRGGDLSTLHGALYMLNNDIVSDERFFLELLESPQQVDLEPMTSCRRGLRPLHVAVASMRFNLVKALIDRGANVNACTRDDNSSPLLLALIAATKNKAAVSEKGMEIIHLLLEAGADGKIANTNCMTPLYAAAYCKDVRVMTLLLQKKYQGLFDINQKTSLNTSHLYIACFEGNYSVAQLLLTYPGIRLGGHQDSADKELFALAAKKLNVELVRFLCDNNLDMSSLQDCNKWLTVQVARGKFHKKEECQRALDILHIVQQKIKSIEEDKRGSGGGAAAR